MPPFLTLEQQLTLLSDLVEIFDRTDEIISQFSNLGFDGLGPFYESMAASAASPEELQRSILVKRERAKELFASPKSWHLPDIPEPLSNLRFKSAILTRLEDERRTELAQEQPSISYEQLPLWEHELDPILRRHMRRSAESHGDKQKVEELIQQRTQVEARHRERRIGELSRFSTSLVDDFGWSAWSCENFYREVTTQEIRRLGFEYDSKRSKHPRAVFTKNLADSWDQCFLATLNLWTPEQAYMDLQWAVVPSSAIERPKSPDHGDFMFIRYDLISPFFKAAYWRSGSLRELEVVLKAWISLLWIMEPFFSSRLVASLPSR